MRSAGIPIFSQSSIVTWSGPSPSCGSPACTVARRGPLEPHPLAHELGRELDPLEVLAEREVAEHLEERERPLVPDLVDVGRAEALHGRRQRCRRRLPPRYGIWGCIPAVVSSVEWSSARGTSDAEGTRRCPLLEEREEALPQLRRRPHGWILRAAPRPTRARRVLQAGGGLSVARLTCGLSSSSSSVSRRAAASLATDIAPPRRAEHGARTGRGRSPRRPQRPS